jgi:hypothetical protein
MTRITKLLTVSFATILASTVSIAQNQLFPGPSWQVTINGVNKMDYGIYAANGWNIVTSAGSAIYLSGGPMLSNQVATPAFMVNSNGANYMNFSNLSNDAWGFGYGGSLGGTGVNVMTLTDNAGISITPNNGHLLLGPGIAAPTGPSANVCTGFALATNSSDTAGRVTYTSATTCSITFGHAYANIPFCTVTPGSAASTVLAVPSTTGLAVTFGTANTAFQYSCFGS